MSRCCFRAIHFILTYGWLQVGGALYGFPSSLIFLLDLYGHPVDALEFKRMSFAEAERVSFEKISSSIDIFASLFVLAWGIIFLQAAYKRNAGGLFIWICIKLIFTGAYAIGKGRIVYLANEISELYFVCFSIVMGFLMLVQLLVLGAVVVFMRELEKPSEDENEGLKMYGKA